MIFVADASTAIAWMMPHQATEVSERAFKLAAKNFFVVPALWQLEVQNVILKLIRQRKISAEDGHEIRLELILLSKRVDGILDAYVFDHVWAIATTHMMTLYDSAYVELALRLNIPIATDDTAMRSAAEKLGIPLI